MNAEIGRKRVKNEKKFSCWKELEGGGRKYWYEVVGKFGFRACYVKEVDEKPFLRKKSFTKRNKVYYFWIKPFLKVCYKGNLVEVHEKFPTDFGHRKIEKKRR